jgi:hypothetical protein
MEQNVSKPDLIEEYRDKVCKPTLTQTLVEQIQEAIENQHLYDFQRMWVESMESPLPEEIVTTVNFTYQPYQSADYIETSFVVSPADTRAVLTSSELTEEAIETFRGAWTEAMSVDGMVTYADDGTAQVSVPVTVTEVPNRNGDVYPVHERFGGAVVNSNAIAAIVTPATPAKLANIVMEED